MKEKVKKILLIFLATAAALSGFKIFTYFYEGRVGENFIDDLKSEYYSQPDLKESLLAVDSDQERIDKFKNLRLINSDVVGWLRVFGTDIDYPVVQTTNNNFYLRRNLQKERAIRGSIFMDYESAEKADNFHTIIYGHNMKDGTMFGDFGYFGAIGPLCW